MRILGKLRDPRVRGYAYRVLVAVGAILAGYGLVSGAELALWLALAATILGTGTAAVNTPTSARARAARGRPEYARLVAGRHRSRTPDDFEQRGRT